MRIVVERDIEKAEKVVRETSFAKSNIYVLKRIRTKDFSSSSWIIVPKGYNAYEVC